MWKNDRRGFREDQLLMKFSENLSCMCNRCCEHFQKQFKPFRTATSGEGQYLPSKPNISVIIFERLGLTQKEDT